VNPNLVLLSVLFFSSGIMCVAMTLAWLHFGRERHVLYWASAYGLSMMQWVSKAIGIGTGSLFAMAMVDIFALLSSGAVVISLRQRAGLRLHVARFGLVVLLGSMGVAYAFSAMGSLQLQGGVATAIACGILILGVKTLWSSERRLTPPEWALFTMLTLFALFLALLATVAIFVRPDISDAGMALHRTVLAFGLPPIYVATGVAAVLVIAGDLASQLGSMVSYDQLTGILNRRGMEQAAEMAIANARRQKRRLAAVICDMDSFKALNDGYGHIAGDAALRAFAGALLSAVRKGDVVGRLGGDEFCVLLVDSSGTAAVEVMERVRASLSAMAVAKLPGGSVRASFGVAEYMPGDIALDDLIARADRALYVSKQRGRDQVTLWTTEAA
jgi:diguanylate cyclase (GGDEF)-like protein